MIGLAQNPTMENPGYRRLLLTKTLPLILKEVLSQTYACEPANVIFLAQEALQSVARALAKVCCFRVWVLDVLCLRYTWFVAFSHP